MKAWQPLDSAPKDGRHIALLIKFTGQFHLTKSGNFQAITRARWNGERWDYAGVTGGTPKAWLDESTTFWCGCCDRHLSILLKGIVAKGRKPQCVSCQQKASIN